MKSINRTIVVGGANDALLRQEIVLANAKAEVYPSYAAAQAANVPPQIQFLDVSGLRYRADPDGTALATNGGSRKWSPLGDAHPEHWGATGEEEDSSPIFQAILDWISDRRDRRIVDRFTGTRVFKVPLTSTGHVQWDAGSATYLVDHPGNFLMAHGNSSPAIRPLDADYIIGSTTISAALPVVPKRGDWLRIVSNRVNPFDRSRIGNSNKYRVQEYVQAGAGSTGAAVSLSRPLRFVYGMNDAEDAAVPAYTIAAGARICLFDSSKAFQFTGGTITYPDGLTVGPDALNIRAYYMPVVQSVRFYRIYGSAVRLDGTIEARVRDCLFEELSDNETGPQNGYGVCDGGENTLIEACDFRKCRHAYTTLRVSLGLNTANVFSGGNTVGGRVVNCNSTGCTSTHFDAHHGALDIVFQSCQASGGECAFGGRAVGARFIGCSCFATNGAFAIFMESAGIAGRLDACTPQAVIEGGIFQSAGESLNARWSRVSIRDAVFESPTYRSLIVGNSLVDISGVVRFSASDLGAGYPIQIPTSSYPVSIRSESGTQFGGSSILRIMPGATLELMLDGFSTIVNEIFLIDANSRVNEFGTLRVSAPANATLVQFPADRFRTTAASQFEKVLPSENFNFGTAAGKFAVSYDSNGAPL